MKKVTLGNERLDLISTRNVSETTKKKKSSFRDNLVFQSFGRDVDLHLELAADFDFILLCTFAILLIVLQSLSK